MKRSYGKIRYMDGHWVVSDVPPHVSIFFKKIFTKVNATSLPPFKIRASGENSEDLRWFIKRYPMRLTRKGKKKLIRESNRYRFSVEENFKIIEGTLDPEREVGFKKGKALKKFQRVIPTIFKRKDRLLLADEVGLGKTVTALGTLTSDKKKLPAIIVVPSNLPDQWAAEIEKFTNLSYELIMSGKQRTLPAKDVYIIKYTILSKWVDILVSLGCETIIFDEIQEVRRMESEKHRHSYALASNIRCCLALSGTPIMNYGHEVFNIYRIIDEGLFPSFSDFSREWLTGFKGIVKDGKALGSYLKEQCAYIRRTREDVKLELPPVNKFTHTVGYDQRAIDDMEKRAQTLARDVLKGDSFIERGNAAKQLSVMVRKATGVSKAKYVADYLKIILESGEKVVLGGWHREFWDIVEKELKDYKIVKYTGSETPKQKEASKQSFIKGDAQVLFLSLRSGVGIDGLQNAAKYVVFGELDWNAAIHEQFIGRLYRTGQENMVTAIFLISNSGSDPIVVDIVGLKKSQFTDIFSQGNKETKAIKDDSIIKSYAQRILKGS